MYRRKLDNTITFPLYDLNLREYAGVNLESNALYNLFGIIVNMINIESFWFIIGRTLYCCNQT
jgi:hypothetical protein